MEARTQMDDYLETLLNTVDEIYTKTKNNELSMVEDVSENIVGTDKFIISAEPAINPAFYNYITNIMNVRLSKNDVLGETTIYHKEESILYRDLNNSSKGDEIKLAIIDEIADLSGILMAAKEEQELEEIGRGSR